MGLFGINDIIGGIGLFRDYSAGRRHQSCGPFAREVLNEKI